MIMLWQENRFSEVVVQYKQKQAKGNPDLGVPDLLTNISNAHSAHY
ncbi:hypothetical protein SAMN05444008_11157 [Cnuella takakiae]|uniref:Uncharacterized protein n=1 Tax=Cnuella takakiae TaxID=1302690 RepID=A0A1M5DRT2_9BACT|nr:hypothetical protein SAMN05444008_11157 [Cnuella takakiae]